LALCSNPNGAPPLHRAPLVDPDDAAACTSAGVTQGLATAGSHSPCLIWEGGCYGQRLRLSLALPHPLDRFMRLF